MAAAGTQIIECDWCKRKFVVRKRNDGFSISGVICWSILTLFCSEDCARQGCANNSGGSYQGPESLLSGTADRFTEDEIMKRVAESLVATGLPDYGIRLLELLHSLDPVNRRFLFVLSKFLSIAYQRASDSTRREHLGTQLRKIRARLEDLDKVNPDSRTW